jgi:hypothetical protein
MNRYDDAVVFLFLYIFSNADSAEFYELAVFNKF